MHTPLYDLSPALTILALGLLLALLPVCWLLWRNGTAPSKLGPALCVLTLFLTLDLILFGAFTRLSDSGLGCPDWPGCYGQAHPLAAHAQISAAQTAMPTGPVTFSKAWIEMLHRYLATAVGALITGLMLLAWAGRKRVNEGPGAGSGEGSGHLQPWLATASFVWVCVQGAFGALTVTTKLFPAIVSLHLLGAYVLLALLTVQANRAVAGSAPRTPLAQRHWLGWALALLLLQAASGAWVSSNYAVLACSEFPKCQGQWLPAMDFVRGFEIWHPLGESADGTVLSLPALTAIHVLHRSLALLTLTVLALLAWALHRHPALRTPVRLLLGLLVLQFLTGLSNVVLGWPLLAALAHTGGAAALVAVLVWLLEKTERPEK
ncbi:MAG: COX15/CtaA family protein [Rhodoferax sp.]|nr:COX15/CtaA family protein [Rhodoferax sp.]